MNKLAKIITCAALSSAMLFTVACKPKEPAGEQKHNTETRWLSLAITAPDQVFNPFFSTSLVDAKIISQTQASLITSDKINGQVEPVAGDNYPTVAKDYDIKYFDAKTGGSECTSAKAADNGRTEYSFLIKKDLKFSDGKPLTIKDVLFNFYVYLDPVYAGSNTMYSVDIQGLNAYRSNDSRLQDGEGGTNDLAAANAQKRLTELIEYGIGKDVTELSEQGKSDYEQVQKLFREELTSDWNNMVSTWEDTYKVNYTFTAAWQAYLFQEGLISVQRRQYPDGTVREIRFDPESNTEIDPRVDANKEKYANGKIKTTLDPWVDGASQSVAGHTEAVDNGIIEGIESCNGNEDAIRDWCINKVYDTNLGTKDGLDEVLRYWATATNAYNFFLSSEIGKLLNSSSNPQYFISGIRAEKTRNFKGQDLGDEYDVLKIIINRVDPAAIWQFGVSIAPMHVYSGEWEGVNYIDKFNGEQITDYSGAGNADMCFGVKRGDFEGFFQKVLREEKKSGFPVGAGPYKASTEHGGTATSKGEFFSNNLVNYERNEYFETLGIENAKIKNMHYKVVDESRIITSVASEDIDYGEPNATTTNLTEIEQHTDIYGYTHYNTNGYGYVGVNPKFVPNVGVRRIIMRAMNTNLSKNYYGDLGSLLYRPMSTTSWAYPSDATNYYPNGFGDAETVKRELSALGYRDSGDGVYADSDGNKLKYTFTIAGANTDHPAYNMFMAAAQKLNNAGFDITVSTDPNALLKLTSGELAVWAAAWSSGVDPDMYQVYHKDSKATSTLNWGYSTIFADQTDKYNYERGIINTLSDKIMAARKTLERSERKSIYGECLELIMQLACELPVYQRRDLCVYNKAVLDPASLNQQPNETIGLIDRIWEVNYL